MSIKGDIRDAAAELLGPNPSDYMKRLFGSWEEMEISRCEAIMTARIKHDIACTGAHMSVNGAMAWGKWLISVSDDELQADKKVSRTAKTLMSGQTPEEFMTGSALMELNP